jgi:SPP1 gp7 family putative phage head morphogenesis protein
MARPPKSVRKSAAQKLWDEAVRQQIYLEKLKSLEVSKSAKMVDAVYEEVAKLLMSPDFGALSDLKRAELQALQRDVQKTILSIHGNYFKELNESFSQVAEFAAVRESDVITGFAQQVAIKGKIYAPNATTAWKAVKNTPIQATGELLEGFIDNYSKAAVKRVNGAIATGWAQGRTIGELVKDLRGTKANKFKDGLVKNIDKRQAEAVVRTSMQHVANSARMKTWEDNPSVVKGYIWVSTLDGVTSDTCKSLDGQKFKMGRGPMPPIHINCRSTTIPDLGSQFDFLDVGATRSSATGLITSKTTYYEWLKTQPKPFVEDAIGVGKAEIFLSGKIDAKEFARLNLGRNFTPISLKDLKEKLQKQN